ncbi:hypothetical protein RSAG8_10253, partial [Rhizoctonia solani AG-8 WAC10335]
MYYIANGLFNGASSISMGSRALSLQCENGNVWNPLGKWYEIGISIMAQWNMPKRPLRASFGWIRILTRLMRSFHGWVSIIYKQQQKYKEVLKVRGTI